MTSEPLRKPFFIAAYDGSNKEFISSDQVVSIYTSADNHLCTKIRTAGGGEYKHALTVQVPLEKVAALFAAHGYIFFDADEKPAKTGSETSEVFKQVFAP